MRMKVVFIHPRAAIQNQDIMDQPKRVERPRTSVMSISEEVESSRSMQDLLIEIVERRRGGGRSTLDG